ncbi:helix-turn-helix domain-containing protein [Vibrio alginolyticus]
MNEDKELTLGQRLKKARLSHAPQLSQKDVAMRSGVSQPVVSDLERGRTHSSTKIAELAVAVNVNMIWLATGTGEMRDPETERKTELLRLSHAVQKLGLTREQVEELVDDAITKASKMAFKR